MFPYIHIESDGSTLSAFVDGKEVNVDKIGKEHFCLLSSFSLTFDEKGRNLKVIPYLSLNHNLSCYMPPTGEGYINIYDKRNIVTAYTIMKEELGKNIMENCPEGFIQSTTAPQLIEYTNFQINHLDKLYQKFSENGIVAVSSMFVNQIE